MAVRVSRFAELDGDLVVNVILADAEFAATRGWVPCPDEVGPGWRQVEGQWVPPAAPEV